MNILGILDFYGSYMLSNQMTIEVSMVQNSYNKIAF